MRTLIAASLLAFTATACATTDTSDMMMADDACDARAYAVFFETGSATLDSDAAATLNTASDAYAGCDLFRIEVVGYADSVGTSGSNLSLSENRAETVVDQLALRGIMADRVDIVPMGEQTILDNETPDAFERRAVLTLLPQ